MAVAKRVLDTESNALRRLQSELPEDFASVVEVILGNSGRVIVSGMGKSGHVAQKIAATLSSTGTPSHFVHPAEASHGDLGMITAKDICILISNSGETAELGDLIAHARRFSVPIVGISRAPDSTLMRAADFRLLLPDAPEACLIGLAPTTSTTMSLALGDALAMALMESRGFAPEDFGRLHPGGKLGAQLARIGTLMHGPEALPLVPEDMPMQEVLIVMSSKGFGIAALVGADGRLAGVISDGDLRRNMDGLLTRTSGEIATRSPVTVGEEMLAAEAMALLNERKVTALLVIDGQRRPIGVVGIHDLLRAGVA
ncbi:KpsF/GutQ family sugar-phosphate isomerase [Tropicimonas isoalkanivorans]|uniref:Arabinose-5-phosphate isomerase n=1 Tax=Tropicimonas isoalkanivorans TaxID=441112 RepID=A0A1I1HG61_9RHOB|nr:KpsF/GutQ family sugar-phosphate isomerase [Tropicimonas isoalkanivorans]SFC20453.1 arabinose-5-phosphate isomerase [Tropicimonas isoalkanivorans]